MQENINSLKLNGMHKLNMACELYFDDVISLKSLLLILVILLQQQWSDMDDVVDLEESGISLIRFSLLLLFMQSILCMV